MATSKVTIARWLATGFGVLLCHDPTRGIDVARNDRFMRSSELSGIGAAILFFSLSSASFRSSATAC